VSVWSLILVLAAWTNALRLGGAFLLKRATVPPTAEKVLNNITPAVLGALVVAGMFTSGRDLVLDERFFGFVAAGAALIGKVPPLAVIVVAAGATALARALT